MRDTTAAISKVSSATASFASALTNSGVGKAGWSVSAALASSTNRGAFSLVNWATDRTGTGPDALPRPISKWLKNGREKMNEQRRAELWRRGRSVGKRAQTERSSEDWEADMGLQAPTQFGDNRGAFTLKITEMSSTGEILDEMRPVYKGSSMPAEIELEEQQWRVAATKGGLEVKADSKKESGDDNESEDLKDGGDGMLRLFQFDD
ncbi:hypothetical protein GQ44DRAFT_716146 [Phaeosphaeriaceae sp. PMI808]|nr:hypothetical protein GQ44DRAFT_716146 [Phaeosphaeriaceae sp. PMI808]